MQVSDKDVREMMKEVGVEIKGRIYYEDFVRMMTGKIGKAHRRVRHTYLFIKNDLHHAGRYTEEDFRLALSFV